MEGEKGIKFKSRVNRNSAGNHERERSEIVFNWCKWEKGENLFKICVRRGREQKESEGDQNLR